MSSPMSSEKSNDSNDGLNGDIKQEPDPQPSQSSIYADLQKPIPGGTIMQSIDMQNSNTHLSHPAHPVVSMHNGSSHHHDMGHILSEYQTLWKETGQRWKNKRDRSTPKQIFTAISNLEMFSYQRYPYKAFVW